MLARFGLTILLVSAWALPAHAQEAKQKETTGYIGGPSLTPEVDNCSVPAEMSRADRRKRASEHYQRGQTLYDQGDYKGAITEFSSAYCEAPNYSVLHDIAMCFERQVKYEKAVAYFSRYILESPADKIAVALQRHPILGAHRLQLFPRVFGDPTQQLPFKIRAPLGLLVFTFRSRPSFVQA